MLNSQNVGRLFLSAALLACWPSGYACAQALRLDALPVGLRPLGVDITSTTNRTFVAVANSGDNSVSILELNRDPLTEVKSIVPLATVRQVPVPFAVASCDPSEGTRAGFGQRVLVTSPSTDSLSIVDVVQGTVLGRVNVGPQPYSAACFSDPSGLKGIVSSLGDNTLAIVDLSSLTVTAKIPDVPGSRGLHSIDVYRTRQGNHVAWVAGTESNVVTVADVTTSRVLARVPVRGPTSIRGASVASAVDKSILIFNAETLQIAATIPNVPRPEDFVWSGLGIIATMGDRNSIAQVTGNLTGPNNVVTVIPGIPGAAGVAAYSYSRASAPQTAVVLVTSPDSNSLFFIQQQPPSPHEFDASDGASFTGMGNAPGSLVSAFATTGVSQNFFAGSVPLPSALGGVTLRVGGKLDYLNFRWVYSAEGATPAPLLFVGPRQVNFQLPPGIAPGDAVPAQLTRPDGTVLLTTLRVVPSSPGIFTVLMNGQGQAAALNQDSSQNGNPQTMLGARPAARGSVIQIFATGAGATNPPLLPGEPAPASGNPLVFTQAQPTVTIGGKTARVLFSGMAPGFVGLWQINAEVPQDVAPGPAVPLTITASGIASNTVTIAVQ